MSETETKIDDGGPIYPYTLTAGDGSNLTTLGLSIRDYIASAAMQAVISGAIETNVEAPHDETAKAAYRFADAMLEARKAGK